MSKENKMEQTTTLAALPDAAVPYILRSGQGPTLLVAGQVIRVLARGAETAGAFGVVICTAPLDPQPIPMHWHDYEHDTWLCTRGRLQVWCKDESRILYPGDFAYVKPGDTHSYRSVAPHTEFFGVVSPGGWESFFYESGEAYDGVIFPDPKRPFDFRRMGAAMAKYDVKMAPDVAFAEAIENSTDYALPGRSKSYFLQAGYGTRRLLGGHLITALMTGTESDGHIEMHTFAAPDGTVFPLHSMPVSHRFLHVMEGRIEISLQGKSYTLDVGDSVSIPAGVAFMTKVVSRHARWSLVGSGNGMSSYLSGAVQETPHYTWEVGGGPAITKETCTERMRFL